jgi:hypothetical protein
LKFAKSILMGTGAVVLAGLILALLAPKAAHAIVATAVQVENTVASPVVSQSILPGVPFSTNCTATGGAIGGVGCQLVPPVPAGYTFHATYFFWRTDYLVATKVPDALDVSYFSNGHEVEGFDIAAPATFFTIAAHPVDWYVDSGSSISVFGSGTNAQLNEVEVTVSGYLTH